MPGGIRKVERKKKVDGEAEMEDCNRKRKERKRRIVGTEGREGERESEGEVGRKVTELEEGGSRKKR